MKQEPIMTPLGGTRRLSSPHANILPLQPREQSGAHWLWLCLHLLLCLLSLMLLKMLAEDCFFFAWQLLVVAYDDGEPPRENSTLVEITVLQPSVIPVFTQEEYRYRTGIHGHSLPHSQTVACLSWYTKEERKGVCLWNLPKSIQQVNVNLFMSVLHSKTIFPTVFKSVQPIYSTLRAHREYPIPNYLWVCGYCRSPPVII